MTRLYGVLGYPIGHSMSPLMHNDAFSHHDIEGHYTAFAVKPDNLADAVKGIRALNISGCNVTTPHKVEIMNYLDEIDEVARGIGAVNTVVNQDGKLIGYNTDGIGFITALEEISGPLQEKNILLIGAGGACRAIYFTLASLGVSNVDLTNRTVEKAVELAASCPYATSGKTMTITEAEKLLAKYDIIVNTTTVGMYPKVEETPISVENLGSHCIVSDIIYNPLQTKLLREAQAKGAVIQNGIGMFVYQGALAFEKWTDKMPDVARMTKIVETQLGGNKTC